MLNAISTAHSTVNARVVTLTYPMVLFWTCRKKPVRTHPLRSPLSNHTVDNPPPAPKTLKDSGLKQKKGTGRGGKGGKGGKALYRNNMDQARLVRVYTTQCFSLGTSNTFWQSFANKLGILNLQHSICRFKLVFKIRYSNCFFVRRFFKYYYGVVFPQETPAAAEQAQRLQGL